MIDLSMLSLREYILIAATLVGGYLLLSLLPLLRIGSKKRKATEGADKGSVLGSWTPVVQPASPSAASRQEPREVQREVPRDLPRETRPGVDARGVSDAAGEAARPELFARELEHSSLDLELRRLRRDVDAMRGEMESMTEEMRQLKATRNVAPIYSEAMILAQQGEAPAGIAAQCGISIGEAELVAALANSGKGEFDDEDDGRHIGAGG